MPVLAGRTREQIRGSIGYNLMGSRFVVSSTTRASGTPNEIFDNQRLFGGDTNHRGKWAYMTSGANDSEIRSVRDFVQGIEGADGVLAHKLVVAPGYTGNVVSGVTYELWEAKFDPRMVEESINQAILDVYGRAFDPEEDLSLHTGGGIAGSGGSGIGTAGGGGISRFVTPTGIDTIRKLEYRERVNLNEVHACDRLFDETTQANITQLSDTSDFRRGGASLRLTVADGLTAGQGVSDSFDAVDMRGRTHIEGWIKSTVALDAADWVIRLDSGTVQFDATDLEVLSVPAVGTALDWQRFVIVLANPELDAAIVSIGFEMSVDKGAHVVWFDDVVVVDQASAVWRPISKQGWSVEREGGYIVLTDAARSDIGYSQIKIIGGGAPVLLTADSTVSEVSAWWIICRATELAFSQAGAEHQGDMIIWRDRAKQARKGLMRIRGGRSTS